MIIPRLKNGGTLAKVINEIIDYLPRLRVQSTPQVLVDHTPRGQIIRLKESNSVPGTPAIKAHPFKVQALGSEMIEVYWGTVGGKEAFSEAKKEFPISQNSRVIVKWTLDLSSSTAGGVSGVSVDVEDVTTDFEITNISGTGIHYKALIATVNIVGDSISILQHVIGHVPAVG